VSVNSTTLTIVKTLAVVSNSDNANIGIEVKANDSNCRIYYEVDVNGTPIITEHNAALTPNWQAFSHVNTTVPQGAFNIDVKLRGLSALSLPKDGGAFANGIGAGTVAWANPSNAQTSNNAYAVATFPTGNPSITAYLNATNFGFAIPPNANITGISATIERIASDLIVVDYTVNLLKGGAPVGANLANTQAWARSYDINQTYGGDANMWGTTWTPAEINATDFGLALSVYRYGGTRSCTASVDHINITVYYTMPVPCQASNRNVSFVQTITKMRAAQNAAMEFVDLASNSSQMALVSYADTAILKKQLMGMASAANKTIMKNAINGLVVDPVLEQWTGREFGLATAVTELISTRNRYPNAVRAAILMSDVNDLDPMSQAITARLNNVTVYPIGYGADANITNLENIALLTNGEDYFEPDNETRQYIIEHIGQ